MDQVHAIAGVTIIDLVAGYIGAASLREIEGLMPAFDEAVEKAASMAEVGQFDPPVHFAGQPLAPGQRQTMAFTVEIDAFTVILITGEIIGDLQWQREVRFTLRHNPCPPQGGQTVDLDQRALIKTVQWLHVDGRSGIGAGYCRYQESEIRQVPGIS